MELEYIETHLVDHCNLQCKGCSHFSSLSEKYFIDATMFKKDLLRLRQLFKNIVMIRLMGGEPLLHPHLSSFIELARSIFNNSRICLVTNGTLLLKQSDTFWKKCSENNIIIQISRYPIPLDIRRIVTTADNFHVKIEQGPAMTYFFKVINMEGNSNPAQSFQHCRSHWSCYFLRDGKIFTCWFAGNVFIFNKFFQKDIPVTAGDYINIHDDVSGADIIHFLSNPKPICSYCLERWPTFQWGISKKRLSEWTLTSSDKLACTLKLKKYY